MPLNTVVTRHTTSLLPDEIAAEARWLRRLTRHLVMDEHGADDLMQETMLAALRRRGGPVESVRAWLGQIARNAAQRRRSRERAPVADPRRPVDGPAADEVLLRAERQRSISDAVMALHEPYRTTVLLRFLEELPATEIAARTGVAVETVRTRIKRGLEILRRRLDTEFGDRLAWAGPVLGARALDRVPVSLCESSTVSLFGVGVMTKLSWSLVVAVVLVVSGWGCWLATSPVTAPSMGLESVDEIEAARVAPPGVDERTGTDVASRDEMAAEPSLDLGSVTVRVAFEADGAPGAGFVLTVGRVGGDPRVGIHRGRADAEGVLRFEGVRPGRLFVRADRSSPRQVFELRAGEDREVVLTIPNGLDVEGIVVDTENRPVPGAEIHFAPLAFTGRDMVQLATAGADGRFALRECYSPCLLGARADGYAPSRLVFRLGRPGTSETVRLVLRGRGGCVQGVVHDPRGRPVAQAVVRIGTGRLDAILGGPAGAAAPPAQAVTGRDGGFCAVGVALGEHPVIVRAVGFAPWRGTCRIEAEGTASLTVSLEAETAVYGTVRDERGQPIAGTSIWWGESDAFDFRSTRSDAAGRFSLGGLSPGLIELHAKRRPLEPQQVELQGVPGSRHRVDFVFRRGIRLLGRVLSEDGDPVRAEVDVRCDVVGENPSWSRSVRTSAAGRFEVCNCPEGKLLTVVIDNHRSAAVTRTGVDPLAGELVVRMARIAEVAATTYITGKVVDPSGKSLVNASVVILNPLRPGGPIYLSRTDGTFQTREMQPGRYRINISSRHYPRYLSDWLDLERGSELDIGTVRLVEGGTVRVRSIAGGDKKLRLWLHDLEGRSRGYLDPRIEPVRLGPVRPGTYQLQLTGAGFAAQIVPVVVQAGQESVADLRVTRGMRVQLIIPTNSWRASSWRRVRISSRKGKVLDRRFEIRRGTSENVESWLEPGNYDVEVFSETHVGKARIEVREKKILPTVEVPMQRRG